MKKLNQIAFKLLFLALIAAQSELHAINGWLYSGPAPYVYELQTSSWHYLYLPEGGIILTDSDSTVEKSWSSNLDQGPDSVTGWTWAGYWPWIWSANDQVWYQASTQGGQFWDYNFTSGQYTITSILDLKNPALVWDESFDDLPNGTSIDQGTTAWTASATFGGSGTLEVRDGRFVSANGNPAIWISEPLAIGGTATVTVTHEGDSTMEGNDHITISTIVDGGDPLPFLDSLEGYYEQRTDKTTVSGSLLQVQIELFSTSSTEYHWIDQVTVEGLDEFPKPFAPSALSAETISYTEIDLSWSDNAENETGFKILRRMSGGEYSLINTVEANVTTYSDNGLLSGTDYEYTVVATNENGDGLSSNQANAKTWGTSVPPAPSQLTAMATGVEVDLAWTDTAFDETNFEIFRRSSSEIEYNLIGSVETDITTFRDRRLDPSTEYSYQVRAVNPSGNSLFSEPTSVTTGEATYPSSEIIPLWPLVNPGFELASGEGGWLEVDPDSVIATSSAASPGAYEERRMLKIEGPSGVMKQALYQPVIGNRYEIRAWVYNHGSISVEDLGTDEIFEVSTNHGDSWKQVSLTFVSTGSPALINVTYGPGTGVAYFDLFEAENITDSNDLATPVPSVLMRYPSQVLDLSWWKITLPINNAQEFYTPDLITLSLDPWFRLVQDEDGYAVQFRANHGGSTTSGSSNPRSELREMTQNYAVRNSRSAADWSNTDGLTHTLWIKQKVTHLTSQKPELVVGQIHDSGDDITVFRIEGHNRGVGVVNTHANLWITNGDATHAYLVDDNYEIGTLFTVKFIAHDGIIEFEYNGERLSYVHTQDVSGCYFKVGNYTQSHRGTAPDESDDAYAETYVYDYEITHQ